MNDSNEAIDGNRLISPDVILEKIRYLGCKQRMLEALIATVDLMDAKASDKSEICRKKYLESLRYFGEIINQADHSSRDSGLNVEKIDLEYIDSLLIFVMHYI